jgi:hypothetical protein
VSLFYSFCFLLPSRNQRKKTTPTRKFASVANIRAEKKIAFIVYTTTNLHIQTGTNFFAWTAFLTAFLSTAGVDSRSDAFFFGFATVAGTKKG